ncbi:MULTISPECIES: TetR/AcrR family transcriptional regulator [unclassified Streptomyces]|uniref:TetR/AcrR family transcriptional regulator n=1 Tax=unclassified Streptomyces TaxID=2593676 RepID=UPI002E137816|nr:MULTISPECIES: TetR/AcrR family transcriptional regulator [unclassified Streptomyces]WSQ82045.1 TetR/AcrR family transcriptional regulator [Streptomyces sp. NBC_01213]WSQ89372.1 TetR/AcrR family transcriptional regulator [Streptomyces sp. NBC_01212]WSR11026.1 TetR/AcrR family transcriptional regulator [Streptomyces sp. NBC_01208]WSR46237.1 TetR/AcrR family transcriptional regulator [Streptomyces sp. NBC_01201]
MTSTPAPGSPAWWLRRTASPTAPRRGRGRPSLDTDHMVVTALRLIDEHGVHAFSLRTLADALGSSTATLYRHFANKDEILALTVDLALGEAGTVPPAAPAGWRDVLSTMGHQVRAVLTRHPSLLPTLMDHVPVGPNALAQRERVLAALLRHGLQPALAARAFTAVGHYVIGFAVQQRESDGAPLADYYRDLDPTTHPAIAATAESLTAVTPDDEFAFGLGLLLEGLARQKDASP